MIELLVIELVIAHDAILDDALYLHPSASEGYILKVYKAYFGARYASGIG